MKSKYFNKLTILVFAITMLFVSNIFSFSERTKRILQQGQETARLGKEFGDKLVEAAGSYNQDQVKEILSKAPTIINYEDKNGNTPLIKAATEQDPDMLKFLIKNGADVDYKNQRGKTALMAAAEGDSLSTLVALIEAKANVNLQDKQGNTALMYSVFKMHNNMQVIVRTLLESGAKKYITNDNHNTALRIAERLSPDSSRELPIKKAVVNLLF